MNNNYQLTYTTKEFSLYKNENIENLFKITLTEPNKNLFLSLKKSKVLTGLTINTFYTTATFQAISVTPLLLGKQSFSYYEILYFIKSLTTQLQSLIDLNQCYYGYDVENILIINNTTMIQISNQYLINIEEAPAQTQTLIQTQDLHKNNTYFFLFNRPFEKKHFLSPELKLIYMIPSKVEIEAIYYSLGSLVIYLLLKKNIMIPENSSNIEEILEPILNTKLYWFIKRCIDPIPINRSILYI
jgi:hypothetical protein